MADAARPSNVPLPVGGRLVDSAAAVEDLANSGADLPMWGGPGTRREAVELGPHRRQHVSAARRVRVTDRSVTWFDGDVVPVGFEIE